MLADIVGGEVWNIGVQRFGEHDRDRRAAAAEERQRRGEQEQQSDRRMAERLQHAY